MNRQDNPEAQLEAANEALRQVQLELRSSQRQLKRILELVEKHQSQLVAHESSIARLDRIIMEMLTGRVWRTLRAAGDLAKRFVPRSNGSDSSSVVLNSRQRSFLVCDEPKPSDLALRSGIISVRGWCVAQGGVDRVQIDVPGIPKIETVPSVPRPDVKKHHPDLDTTGRAGFTAGLRFAQSPEWTPHDHSSPDLKGQTDSRNPNRRSDRPRKWFQFRLLSLDP